MNRVYVTVFDADGVIFGTIACPEHEAHRQAGERFWVLGKSDGSTHWVDLTWPEMPAIMPKQVIEPQVTTDGLVATFASLPRPCVVTVDGSRHDAPSGAIEIEFNLPGKYRIELAHPHYLPKTLEVEL